MIKSSSFVAKILRNGSENMDTKLDVNTENDSIEYLEHLEPGEFCTVNIPLFNNEIIPVTAMFMGKDKEGRYNFIDTGQFILSIDFIQKKSISIDKEFNEDEAFKIYSKVKLLQEKSSKSKKDLLR